MKSRVVFNRVVITSIFLLLPVMVFWVGVLLYVTLGADYLFESVIARIGMTWWGNLLLTFIVIGFPGMTIAASGMGYVTTKKKADLGIVILGGILLALGFLAVMRKG